MIRQGILKIDSLKEFLNEFGSYVVAIDARYVIDVDVLKFAVDKAVRSWKEGRNIAKTLPLEIILYVSATRQIKNAVKICVGEGINEVVLIVLNEGKLENLKFEERNVVKMDEERIENVKKLYGITDEEINVVGLKKLPLLIRERIALFDVFKE